MSSDSDTALSKNDQPQSSSGLESPSSSGNVVCRTVCAAIMGVVGLGNGMGIALGGISSGRSRMELTVMIGLAGMPGGCLFPIVAGLVFPAVNSTWPIPPHEPAAGRILWLALPSTLMGLAVGRKG